MKFSYAIAFALANIALLVDATVFMTQPVGGTKWSFGKKETCKWRVDTETGPAKLELFFRNGLPETAFQGKPILEVQIPDIKAGSVEVDLTQLNPANFPPAGNDYFIRIGTEYSASFTINGGTGAASPAPAASNGAANTPAANANTNGAAASTGAATGAAGAANSGSKVVPVAGPNASNSTASATKSAVNTTVPAGKASSDAKTTVTYSAFAVVAAIIAAFM